MPQDALTMSQLTLALDIGAILTEGTVILPGFTFNPWIGCTKVSRGCKHCYAAELDLRRFSKTLGEATKDAPIVHWGKGAPRWHTAEATWNNPRKWNRQAQALGVRLRVFTASLADWLDDEVPLAWLADFLCLVASCRDLDWLLVTKRPENWTTRLTAIRDAVGDIAIDAAARVFARDWLNGSAPKNVWFITSVEDQRAAEARVLFSLNVPAIVHGLSCEPLMSAVNLERINVEVGNQLDALRGLYFCDGSNEPLRIASGAKIDWVIVGGESGDDADIQPMHPEWAIRLRNQCLTAGTAFFFKQWGEWLPDDERQFTTSGNITWGLIHKQGTFRLCLDKGFRIPGTDVTWLDGESGTTRVGKAAAGRMLRREEHNGFPTVQVAA